MRPKPDFKSSFLALMEESERPTVEELVAFRTGELAPEERERVQRHLEVCEESAELVRDLDLFTDSSEAAVTANEFEVAAFVRALKPQIAPSPSPPASSSWHRRLAMAAGLVLAVGASWMLSRDVAQREFARPRANVPIVDLIQDASLRTGRPAARYELRRDAGGVLILTPYGTEGFADFEARILDSEGEPVHSVGNLQKDPDGDAFVLILNPESLELGDYEIEILGRAGGPAEAIAEYPLRVIGSP